MKMPSGEIRLTPYQPNLWLYRGQTCDHGKCLSSLYRNELSETDLLIARIKEIQFETVLLTHPAVIDLIKNDFHINFKGLAQHYSLKTELLDLTSDYLVAAFFATCSYSCCSNSYFPQTASKIGVIYKTLQLALSSSAPNKRICFDIVGLQ
ncbi:MAG: FRG domain-containing protein, partial [Desulfobacterales bacterium]